MYKKIDPVTLEVIHHRLESITEEAEDTILKASFSIIVKEMKDCTTAIFDAKGRTIAQCIGIPVHLGCLVYSVPQILKEFPPQNAQDGDVYLANDPFSGGTHLPDVTVVTPVIYEGDVVAYSVSMVHHADIGGIEPGVSTKATSIYQEGLNLPPLKFYDRGKPVKVVHDIIRKNVRIPDTVLGDFEAQVAAGNVGKARLLEFFDEFGKRTVLAAIEQILDQSEALTREGLRKIPDGTYSFVDYMDNDGVDLDQLVKLQVAVTKRGSDFIVDFSGSHPQTKGPLNCTPPSAFACAAYAMKVISGGGAIPTNDGCFRTIKLILPQGSVVNANPPASTGCRATTCQAIASTILGALLKAVPERLNASSGAYGPLVYFGGYDPLTGKEYLTNEISQVGLGARPTKDGIDVISVDVDNVLAIPIEAFETSSPYRVLECGLYEGSGGAGEYRGGLGYRKVFELLRGTGSATYRGERYYVPAWGVFGGLPGGLGKGVIVRRTGEKEEVPSKRDYILSEGDRIYLFSSGGGGWGDPLKRKPERVLRDVLDERVSLKAAAGDYGVIIDEEKMTIDPEKTIQLRKEKARLRGPISWTHDKGLMGKE